MDSILDTILNVRIKKIDGKYSLNKPLLLLAALGRCRKGDERLATFRIYEHAVHSISEEISKLNIVFPFGRLPADGVWEILCEDELYRNRSGDLLRSELIEKDVLAGFHESIYNTLSKSSSLIDTIINEILNRYIPIEEHTVIVTALNLISSINNHIAVHEMASFFTPAEGGQIVPEVSPVSDQNNAYITYINSLHNLRANGANALAESQAQNPYFGDIYEPLPIIDRLVEVLKDSEDRVVILTGHAGDGKSTVALDILKKLQNLPPTEPLERPIEEREDIALEDGKITIVKDMSELSAEHRQKWLQQAFEKPGSWLIVSNTGPLLNSLNEYAVSTGGKRSIESEILELLDQNPGEGSLDEQTMGRFNKPLLVINLTRLDNISLGAHILTRLVKHSAWQQCAGCSIEYTCPLKLNREALLSAENVVEKRVRWIYQRINAYEQRLTLRQIVAHLAIGLTGGMSCTEAQQQVGPSLAGHTEGGSDALTEILFSESFFGYRNGKPWPPAENLQAVSLIRRATFGAPVGVSYDRRLPFEAGIGWANLPTILKPLCKQWRQRAAEPAGVRSRFALRRMNYLFGDIIQSKKSVADVFLDTFLQSPSLREFDRWQSARKLTLSPSEKSRLRTSCLQVFLESFSGFSASQFHQHDLLYLTLRRPDKAVVQPTQLVIDALPFAEFELDFDAIQQVPILRFSRGPVELPLPLPLLDYIRQRDAGELGSDLSPIHQAQLDWFRAAVLQATANTKHDSGKIELLRASIDGEVHLHRYLLDKEQGILGKY